FSGQDTGHARGSAQELASGGEDALPVAAADVPGFLYRSAGEPRGDPGAALPAAVCRADLSVDDRHGGGVYSGAALPALRGSLPRAGATRKIPEDVDLPAALRSVMVALAVPAAAPHQLRPGAGLHDGAGLCAVRAEVVDIDGSKW